MAWYAATVRSPRASYSSGRMGRISERGCGRAHDGSGNAGTRCAGRRAPSRGRRASAGPTRDHSTMADRNGGNPLLVFGPRSLTYDFGPYHPLSPRRFGPGIDLLRAVGAEPGLAPEPAPDGELEWLHAPEYVATVRRFSADPSRPAGRGNRAGRRSGVRGDARGCGGRGRRLDPGHGGDPARRRRARLPARAAVSTTP